MDRGISFWRSGWDSNPRAVVRKLISSQPRYDHFDTAAYQLYYYTIHFSVAQCIFSQWRDFLW